MMVLAGPLPVMVSAPPAASRSGKGDASVITPLAEGANTISSSAGVLSAWVIAWRRLPAPLSLVLLTVYVTADAGVTDQPNSRPSHISAHNSRCRFNPRAC